jgi:hypothetical protein
MPSQPQGHSAAGRIMSMKNSSNTIGNRTRDRPTCSATNCATACPLPIYGMTYTVYCDNCMRDYWDSDENADLGGVCREAGPRKLGNYETFSTCNSYCCFCLSPMCTSRPLYTRYVILDICQLGLILTAAYISVWSVYVVSCCWYVESRVSVMCSLV